MTYKVTVNENEIEYGPLVEHSRFTEEEWLAIYTEIVKQNQPEIFEKKKDDSDYINVLGALIALEERYEALLELLPQEQYSRAGTHPKWVADAVDENTLNKEMTTWDVHDFIDNCNNLEELKHQLKEYFELDES